MKTWFFNLKGWLIMPFGILVSFIAIFFYSGGHSENTIPFMSSPIQSKAEVAAAEKLQPEEYITGQIKMRRNFINEVIIEGELRNIARYVAYRDLVLRVDYLSKSGTVLFTRDYPFCERMAPNGFTKYRFKSLPSQDVDRISAKILEAVVCD